MEVKNRTFRKLEKEMTLQKLNEFSKLVTEAYATSEKEYSQTNLAMDNHLTKKGLRDLMDYAIVTAQVSIEIAQKVLEKSIVNQQRKMQEAGGSSINHYKQLMRKRVKFLADSYATAEIRNIAADIANNPTKSIKYFTQKYNIESEKVTKMILQRAIIENIASDEEMEKIIQRSLNGNETKSAKQYFDYLRNERIRNKNSQ